MKTFQTLKQLTVMLLGTLILSGCTTIKLEFNFHPDFATDFSESIWLDQDLASFLGTSQKPGDRDYWFNMRRLAKTFSWTSKEKASNHLVLSGACPNGQQYALANQLANQIAVFAAASGVPAEAPKIGPTIVKYRAIKKEAFFTTENHFIVDLDLTVTTAKKYMVMPTNLAKLLIESGKNRDGIKADVKATFPIPVLSTNGKLDPKSHTVTWPVYVGQLNHFEVAFRIIKWPLIALVVVTVVSTVIGLFFAFLGSRRNG